MSRFETFDMIERCQLIVKECVMFNCCLVERCVVQLGYLSGMQGVLTVKCRVATRDQWIHSHDVAPKKV